MEALGKVRILDFTRQYLGPFGTLMPAFMGAEVVRVESEKAPDIMRLPDPTILGTLRGVKAGFNSVNLNKKSIRLDLSRPEAIDIVKRLVSISDVVTDNFRTGTMEKFGLGYAVLKEVNPSIIMVSISSHGATGPEREYRGYAALFGPSSGQSYITGYPDGMPVTLRSTGDFRAGIFLSFTLLALLNYRQRTGKGGYIDLSANEALTNSIGDVIMEYTMNGTIRSRQANHDDVMAPHNCYRCRGEDKWVSIAISTEEEWHAFCKVLGKPEWTEDERFSNGYSRWQNQDELDKLIEQWTTNYTHYEVMEMLQKVGVAAVPSLSNQELSEDAHCKSRGLFQEVEHPELGKQFVVKPPWRLSRTPLKIKTAGPLLGEHNEYVLGQLLGFSEEEIQKLVRDGVLN